VVQQNYDAIGRLCAIAQTSSGCTSNTNPYAPGYGYNTAFELMGFNYANGVAASFGYSPDRLQTTSLSYVKGTTTLYSLNYSYGSAGSNNGQIQSITDNVDNGRSETFSYDNLARLKNATTTGSTGYPQWGLQWTYDAYGNRLHQDMSAGCVAPMNCPTNQVAVSTATNRITTTGYAYDANGNMTNDGSNTLTYDGENHLLTSSGALGSGTYTYDGNGLRVKKVSSSTTTVYSFSGSKVIAEYVNGAVPASPTREYIYSRSALLAKIEGTATQYYQQDHLSTRLMTDSTGTKIGEQGHFPYGETWYVTNTTTKWEFTSYERDAESGNDYAMARYHVNRLGRFSSPDLIPGSAGNPQSLNKFAYVHNDPTNRVDPSGMLDCWWPDTCGGEDPGGGGGGGCLLGFCSEDPPSGGHPDTCGTFCGPAGDFGFPGSPATNGFIATGPGIDWLNVLFGPPNPALVIFNAGSTSICLDSSGSPVSCESTDAVSNCANSENANNIWCMSPVIVPLGSGPSSDQPKSPKPEQPKPQEPKPQLQAPTNCGAEVTAAAARAPSPRPGFRDLLYGGISAWLGYKILGGSIPGAIGGFLFGITVQSAGNYTEAGLRGQGALTVCAASQGNYPYPE
jgi:RHS repeat-associated protein